MFRGGSIQTLRRRLLSSSRIAVNVTSTRINITSTHRYPIFVDLRHASNRQSLRGEKFSTEKFERDQAHLKVQQDDKLSTKSTTELGKGNRSSSKYLGNDKLEHPSAGESIFQQMKSLPNLITLVSLLPYEKKLAQISLSLIG